MMVLLQAHELYQSIGTKELIQHVDLEIRSGDRIGLIGPNGEGKSTLMRMLAGVDEPESGTLLTSCITGYIPQSMEGDGSLKVTDWFARQDVLPNLEIAKELGVGDHVWERPVESLSGGEQTKIALLAALSVRPELLLLDEPTNHLDLDAVRWLEKTLKKLKVALVVISHDRRFLDEVTNTTWELKKGKLTAFPGNYTHYAAWVESERERIEQEYSEYLKEKGRLEEAITRKQQWAAKGAKGRKATDSFARHLKAIDQARVLKTHSTVKAMQRRLDDMEPEEKPEQRLVAKVRFLDIEEAERPVLVRGEEISFGYEERRLLTDVNFEVEKQDRIALIGPNGAGKTTLLKMFTGELAPQEGQLRVTPTANLGYFDQVFATLNLERSLLDDLLQLDGMDRTTARIFLGSFLFRDDEVFRKLSTLSYGERVRYVFVKLILSRTNTLVLDEPSNHLDIVTREKVEEALSDYPGAVICASHDRYFLEKLTNKVWELRDGKLTVHPYGFKEYWERQQEQKSPKQPGKGKKEQKQNKQLLKDEILQIETRLAQLSWELSTVLDAVKKGELDREFIDLSRRRNGLRAELNG
ncbi:hypothetical protein CBW65_06845 [Tumebacillus avium]|uniref:ABC transporter domain-containing protein n=1 Tax=Tumebacillus avium TaxID=1903704 RepID=A0A1Y0IK13_9BACL|nr:ABC-F type ribosomal protection protein [Tumebacillus avium]ARU60842.1 hypothetical protein CBW65_06845 [Tumebacillus avium]